MPSKVAVSALFLVTSQTCENATYVLSNYEATVVRDLIPEKNITAIFKGQQRLDATINEDYVK